jgi:ABC-type antimicrobial peptide transport system permease subunit
VLGSLLGLLVCVLFSINGIDFSAWSEGLRQLGAVDFRIFPKYRSDMLILAFITGVGTSLVAGIYPALRILRLKVVTALRPIQ